MYHLVSVNHNSMAPHLTKSDSGLRSAVHPVQWMGLIMTCCGMAVKRMGVLGVSVRKMKALNVKMETVTLIGKGRSNLTRCVY
jgi:hypothetical protein